MSAILGVKRTRYAALVGLRQMRSRVWRYFSPFARSVRVASVVLSFRRHAFIHSLINNKQPASPGKRAARDDSPLPTHHHHHPRSPSSRPGLPGSPRPSPRTRRVRGWAGVGRAWLWLTCHRHLAWATARACPHPLQRGPQKPLAPRPLRLWPPPLSSRLGRPAGGPPWLGSGWA